MKTKFVTQSKVFLAISFLSLNLFAKSIIVDIPEDYFPDMTAVGNPDGTVTFSNLFMRYDGSAYHLYGNQATAEGVCKLLKMKYASYESVDKNEDSYHERNERPTITISRRRLIITDESEFLKKLRCKPSDK